MLHRLCAVRRWGQSGSAELAVIERGIPALTGQQLLVTAHLLDVAVLHIQDHVRVPDGGQPVGDDKAGAPLHQLRHGLLDQDLRVDVHIAGGLVQDQDLGVGGDGPCDGDELALPLGDVLRPLAQHHVIAAGKGFDEAVGAGGAGRGDHLLPVHIRLPIGDVVGDGALNPEEALAAEAAEETTEE